jgi:hypothetical protein
VGCALQNSDLAFEVCLVQPPFGMLTLLCVALQLFQRMGLWQNRVGSNKARQCMGPTSFHKKHQPPLNRERLFMTFLHFACGKVAHIRRKND